MQSFLLVGEEETGLIGIVKTTILLKRTAIDIEESGQTIDAIADSCSIIAGDGIDGRHTGNGIVHGLLSGSKTLTVKGNDLLSEELGIGLTVEVDPDMLVGGAGLATHRLGKTGDLTETDGLDILTKVHMDITEDERPGTIRDSIEHRTGLDETFLRH